MRKYVIRRILLFIPSLLAVTLIAFAILVNTPGNPVDRLLNAEPDAAGFSAAGAAQQQREQWIRKLGLDLPVFYFSVEPLSDASESSWKEWIPVLRFHPDNQYHRWLFGDGNWLTGAGAQWSKGVVRGDFGLSYQTRQPVTKVISERITWSLLLSVLSVILAMMVSIPIAVASVKNPGSFMDQASSWLLTWLFSVPTFWMATLLLMIFANPDVFPWFPASGVKPAIGYPTGAGWLEKTWITLPYLILPLICYTYGSLAFLSGTLRESLKDALAQDYSRTAKAKGLADEAVVYKHAFRNSLLPLITLAAQIFPAAIGGSVILETVFSIPGMGSEIVTAIQMQNYPMIVAVFTITSFLTMSGILLADIGYAIADPRIRFVKK